MDATPTLDNCTNVDASMPALTKGTSTPRPTFASTSCASSRVPEVAKVDEPNKSEEVARGDSRPPQPNKRRLWI